MTSFIFREFPWRRDGWTVNTDAPSITFALDIAHGHAMDRCHGIAVDEVAP